MGADLEWVTGGDGGEETATGIDNLLRPVTNMIQILVKNMTLNSNKYYITNSPQYSRCLWDR